MLTTPRSVEGLLGDPNVGLARLGTANGWAFAAEYGESRGSVQDGLVRLAGEGEAT